MQRPAFVLAAAAGCLLQLPAHAQTGGELAEIRQQLDAMRKNYESRIEALEKQVKAGDR